MASSSESDSGKLSAFCTFVFDVVKKPFRARALSAAGPAKIATQIPSSSGNVWAFKDVPKPPEPMLRLTLRHQSSWEKLKSATRQLPQQHALRQIEAKRQRILQEAYKSGSLSQDDVDFLNQSMKAEIDSVFDKFQKNLQETIKIEPGESAEIAREKIQLVKEITKWLESLMKWLTENLNAILSEVENKGPQWCIQQAERLFQELYDAFAERLPEPAQGVLEAPEEGEDVVSRMLLSSLGRACM